MPPLVSVVIAAHNPERGRLGRTLQALRAQTLPAGQWELILVDNASSPPVDVVLRIPLARTVVEPKLGLSFARRRGFTEASAPIIVMVDDDNVLAPDYLAHVLRLFAADAQLGALGGRSLPQFEREPEAWHHEFFPLLALRDLGPAPIVAALAPAADGAPAAYPACAPVGAGMALRRAAVEPWLAEAGSRRLTDRRGGDLTSGGDNDIVLTILRAGWKVGYFPELSLKHLIPAARLEPAYLGRLNRSIQKSWMQVLSLHNANPWPPIAGWTVPLRHARAWLRHRAWAGWTEWIRWQGACGHFEGRVVLPATNA